VTQKKTTGQDGKSVTCFLPAPNVKQDRTGEQFGEGPHTNTIGIPEVCSAPRKETKCRQLEQTAFGETKSCQLEQTAFGTGNAQWPLALFDLLERMGTMRAHFGLRRHGHEALGASFNSHGLTPPMVPRETWL
jgi:hypothetical protein